MGDRLAKHVHGVFFFNEGQDRWSAPNPDHEAMVDARHRARYPESGQKPNYLVASQADVYAYLAIDCPTDKAACEKLRAIRRAVAEARKITTPSDPKEDQ